MNTRLPPLNALRTFEAAARRGGFTAAAEELHVTPAAVSQQVKSLENYLDQRLFHRHARGLQLTEAGRQLVPQLTRGLAHFSRAIGTVTATGLSGRIAVSAAPSFAALWLVPRLQGFMRSYPEIQLRVLGSTVAPDLNSGEVDIRMPYGMGQYPGFVTRPLMRGRVFPVCSPMLLNHSPLRQFADLRQHTLLHDINTGVDEPTLTWERWLRDSGVGGVDPEQGMEFGDSVLMTEAAVRGQGVALGRDSLVAEHLASGRLVRPLKASRPADFAYYTVTTQGNAEHPRIQAFINWIEEQVEREQRGPDQAS
jgi:LysR family glycine cleavage system transcriptional activator